MRKSVLWLATLFAGLNLLPLTAQTTNGNEPSLSAQQSGWKLIWNEEFDTDGPYNREVWEAEQGFVRNHEAQWYQEDNAYQKNGCLVIEARKERRKNPTYKSEGRRDWRSEREYIEYTSSSLTTRRSFSFLYGRLEVRAKIPTAGGAWPAIWLWVKTCHGRHVAK